MNKKILNGFYNFRFNHNPTKTYLVEVTTILKVDEFVKLTGYFKLPFELDLMECLRCEGCFFERESESIYEHLTTEVSMCWGTYDTLNDFIQFKFNY